MATDTNKIPPQAISSLGAIRKVDNFANVAAETGLRNGERLQIGYGDGRVDSDIWVYDSGSTATENATASGPGTILNGPGGTGRFLRQFQGAYHTKWFGAAADGTTDDSTEISATFAAAGSDSEVVIDYGANLIASQVTVTSSRLKVRFDGSLKASATRFSGGMLRFTGSDIALIEPKLDCNGAAIDAITPYQEVPDYDTVYSAGIVIDGVVNFSIHKGDFRGLYTRFLDARNSTNISITNSYSHSPAAAHNSSMSEHYFILSCLGSITFTDNIVDNDTPTSTTQNPCGLSVTPTDESCVVTGNTFKRLGRDGLHRLGPIDFYGGCKNTTIDNNQFVASNWMICRMNGPSGARFTNNYCESNNYVPDFPLIAVMADLNTTIDISDVIVSGNTIKSATSNASTAIGVYSDDWSRRAHNVQVANNTITNITDPIRVLGSYDQLSIVGNVLKDAAANKGIVVDEHGGAFGTEANGIYSGLRIEDNEVIDGQIYVLAKASFAGTFGDRCIVKGNTVHGGNSNAFGILAQYIPHIEVKENHFKSTNLAIYIRFGGTVAQIDNNVLDTPTSPEISCDYPVVLRKRNRLLDGTLLDADNRKIGQDDLGVINGTQAITMDGLLTDQKLVTPSAVSDYSPAATVAGEYHLHVDNSAASANISISGCANSTSFTFPMTDDTIHVTLYFDGTTWTITSLMNF